MMQIGNNDCGTKNARLNMCWRNKHVFVFCKTRKFLLLGEVQKLRQDVEILLNLKTTDTTPKKTVESKDPWSFMGCFCL